MNQQDTVWKDSRSAGAFLAENPEAFGMISDAHPLATDQLLLAVNGYLADDGMYPPTFTVTDKGVAGLYSGLYETLIPRSEINEHILRLTFGESEGRQTHPIARYSAALAEIAAYDFLTGEGQALSASDGARQLSRLLPQGIDGLRDVMRNIAGPRSGSERFFSVSFCACRINEQSKDTYTLDIYTAGDFSLYLLDEAGLCPLWTKDTDYLTGDELGVVEGHSLSIRHEDPFAIIMLSQNACEPSLAEQRSIHEHPGLLWRHRMRLEEQLLRLILESVGMENVAERAAHYFGGRSAGWESVTGAMTVCGGGFDALRSLCMVRLRRLENLMALLPGGYDPRMPVVHVPEKRVEREFILSAFKTRPRLLEKTAETLSACAVELLRSAVENASEEISPAGLRRLTYEDVKKVFNIYDAENTADRTAIHKNCRMIKALLSEHWITLRPLLCGDLEDTAQGKAAFDACIRLNQRLSKLTAGRRKLLQKIKDRLTDHLAVLEFQGEDWVHGRGGDDSARRWLDDMGSQLPALTADAMRSWERVSLYLRTYQAAYTKERESLFMLDVAKDTGIWHGVYEQILRGTLEEAAWEAYGRRIKEASEDFCELWGMVKALSLRIATLGERIEGRAAERRTLQAISRDEGWQIACMLGALYEDEAWGQGCLQMVDNGFRNEHKALIRRHREKEELTVRQKEAFEAYRRMYETYESL